jgi:hypothetical protein
MKSIRSGICQAQRVTQGRWAKAYEPEVRLAGAIKRTGKSRRHTGRRDLIETKFPPVIASLILNWKLSSRNNACASFRTHSLWSSCERDISEPIASISSDHMHGSLLPTFNIRNDDRLRLVRVWKGTSSSSFNFSQCSNAVAADIQHLEEHLKD